MSLPVMVWVLENSEATLGARLVLLVLAEHAHDDGTNAWPSVETIARRTRMTPRGVQKALDRLRDHGWIEKTGTSPKGTSIYRLHFRDKPPAEPPPAEPEGGEPRSGANLVRGEREDAQGANMVPQGGERGSPEPRTEPTTGPVIDPAYALARRDPSPAAPATSALAFPKEVAKRKVTEAEGELAVAVLASWNEQARQAKASQDWLVMIVMRIREYPDLDLDAHAAVIAQALAVPWWQGNPDPGVVYRNGAQFERCLEDASAPPPPPATRDRGRRPPRKFGYGTTAAETLAYAERLRAEEAGE